MGVISVKELAGQTTHLVINWLYELISGVMGIKWVGRKVGVKDEQRNGKIGKEKRENYLNASESQR